MSPQAFAKFSLVRMTGTNLFSLFFLLMESCYKYATFADFLLLFKSECQFQWIKVCLSLLFATLEVKSIILHRHVLGCLQKEKQFVE